MLFKLPTILSISLLAAARPATFKIQPYFGPLGEFGGCPTEEANLTLPEDQTALSVPKGQAPNYILLGTGVQNYTCSDAGKYTSSGAVARLYDISCLVGIQDFSTVQDEWLARSPEDQDLLRNGLKSTALFIADHYFVTNSTGTGISPKFASSRNGGATFAIMKKVASIPAPNATNVDWLRLSSIDGSFAKTIFRVDTKAGQPPDSCTPDSDPISVPYAAKYWLFR